MNRKHAAIALVTTGLLFTAVAIEVGASEKVLTCKKLTAVDGDTARCDGLLLRDMGDGAPGVSGYDTPEIRSYKCPGEKALAIKAKRRMAELLKTKGLVIVDSGATTTGRGGKLRLLVSIRLPDGSTVGRKLIEEGLARRWTPEYKAEWCSGESTKSVGARRIGELARHIKNSAAHDLLPSVALV